MTLVRKVHCPLSVTKVLPELLSYWCPGGDEDPTRAAGTLFPEDHVGAKSLK